MHMHNINVLECTTCASSIECAYWEKFQQLTALLQSLNLFHFVVAFAVSSVIEEEVLC